MELGSKKRHPENPCLSEPEKSGERREMERFQMNPTLLMLDRSMSEMLLERTNANKKAQGKSIYKIIIKLLHCSKKPSKQAPFPSVHRNGKLRTQGF